MAKKKTDEKPKPEDFGWTEENGWPKPDNEMEFTIATNEWNARQPKTED